MALSRRIEMTTLFALHGFLGLPSDWDFLKAKLHAIDVLALHRPEEGLWNWAKACNALARRLPAPRFLLGYSMGARLAMHALLDDPSSWEGALFVSGHPGLKSDEEKTARGTEDRLWADRFHSDSWELLMRDWNSQPVFQRGNPLIRNEQDYSRPQLAEAIVHFSTAFQEDLSLRLDQCPVPQLWIAGEWDAKYASIARSRHSHRIVPQSGHRIPWDNPELFKQYLFQFIEENSYASARVHLARDQEIPGYQTS